MCKHASLSFRLALASGGVGIATLTYAQTSPPPPTPDDPKVFVWSNGIPCGYAPQQDDSMVAMARLWLNYNTTPIGRWHYSVVPPSRRLRRVVLRAAGRRGMSLAISPPS